VRFRRFGIIKPCARHVLVSSHMSSTFGGRFATLCCCCVDGNTGVTEFASVQPRPVMEPGMRDLERILRRRKNGIQRRSDEFQEFVSRRRNHKLRAKDGELPLRRVTHPEQIQRDAAIKVPPDSRYGGLCKEPGVLHEGDLRDTLREPISARESKKETTGEVIIASSRKEQARLGATVDPSVSPTVEAEHVVHADEESVGKEALPRVPLKWVSKYPAVRCADVDQSSQAVQEWDADGSLEEFESLASQGVDEADWKSRPSWTGRPWAMVEPMSPIEPSVGVTPWSREQQRLLDLQHAVEVLGKAFPAFDHPSTLPSGDASWEVVLCKTGQPRVGLAIKMQLPQNSLRIESIHRPSAADEWNRAHPHLAIRAGDRVLEVNDLLDDPRKMASECTKAETLRMRVVRPAESDIDSQSS